MRKIGEIKGIPVVEGNKNEITKNQLHYEETGGGIQLSKRGNDNKLNSVTGSSSSSSGEGVKEYYCRISNEISHELREMLKAVLNMVVVSSVLDYRTIDGFNYCYKLTNGMNRDGSGTPLSDFYATIIAFSYLDRDTHFISYSMDKPTRLTGDLFDKLSQVAGGKEAEAIKQMLEPYFQEITKEEYESMITYKPE